MELSHKERHVLSGIGVQIVLVGLLVFAYTQAVRQMKLQAALSHRLQEQVVVARERLAQKGPPPDLNDLQRQVAEMKEVLIPPAALNLEVERLQAIARLQDVQLEVRVTDQPVERVVVPLVGPNEFETHLYALEGRGAASSRQVAGLLAGMADSGGTALRPLVAMEMNASDPPQPEPVRFYLKWLIAASPDSTAPPTPSPLPKGPPSLKWGEREEPFRAATVPGQT